MAFGRRVTHQFELPRVARVDAHVVHRVHLEPDAFRPVRPDVGYGRGRPQQRSPLRGRHGLETAADEARRTSLLALPVQGHFQRVREQVHRIHDRHDGRVQFVLKRVLERNNTTTT